MKTLSKDLHLNDQFPVCTDTGAIYDGSSVLLQYGKRRRYGALSSREGWRGRFED